jgi:hypothetical protein
VRGCRRVRLWVARGGRHRCTAWETYSRAFARLPSAQSFRQMPPDPRRSWVLQRRKEAEPADTSPAKGQPRRARLGEATTARSGAQQVFGSHGRDRQRNADSALRLQRHRRSRVALATTYPTPEPRVWPLLESRRRAHRPRDMATDFRLRRHCRSGLGAAARARSRPRRLRMLAREDEVRDAFCLMLARMRVAPSST